MRNKTYLVKNIKLCLAIMLTTITVWFISDCAVYGLKKMGVEVEGFGIEARAAEFYMPDDCANLQACFGLMAGGDELIIRDGVWLY